MMKKIILGLTMLLGSITTFGKNIKINETVRSTDGCLWKITGTIDVGCCPSIKGYDITMDGGPCGKHHFQGIQVNPDGSPSPIEEPSTNAYNMHLYDAQEQLEPLSNIDTQFFISEMLRICNENGWTNE